MGSDGLRRQLRELVLESRFFPLLAVLVLFLFVVYPLTVTYGHPGLLLNLFALTMFAVSLRAVAGGHRMIRVVRFLFVLMIATRLWTYLDEGPWVLITYIASSVLFNISITLVCLSRVLGREPVDTDKIIGAICVYLLIGVIFSYLYEIIFILDPGSFDLGPIDLSQPGTTWELWVFSYFSFVTLTTLGYGDILPTTAFTRSVATLEAIVGPMYLAILVARLVSLRDAAPPQKNQGSTTP